MTTTLRDSMPSRPPGISAITGTATLNGLSNVTVPVPSITATSMIVLGYVTPQGTLGVLLVTSKTPGVGFTIASIALNTSVVGYMVIEP